MHLPEDAVRHKMRMEQADPKIIFVVLGEDFQTVTPTIKTTVKAKLTPEEDEVAKNIKKCYMLVFPKILSKTRCLPTKLLSKSSAKC